MTQTAETRPVCTGAIEGGHLRKWLQTGETTASSNPADPFSKHAFAPSHEHFVARLHR